MERNGKRKKQLCERVVVLVLGCPTRRFPGLTVTALARKVGVSASHLSRRFKDEYNITIRSFLLREKISRSSHLLKAYPQLSIKSVANLLDFCSADYYIKVFKRVVGTTPGRYREVHASRDVETGRRLDGGDRRINPFKQRRRNERRRAAADRRNGISNRRGAQPPFYC